MPRFEFQVIAFPVENVVASTNGPPAAQWSLNECGQDGWELKSFTPDGDGFVAVLQREVVEERSGVIW